MGQMLTTDRLKDKRILTGRPCGFLYPLSVPSLTAVCFRPDCKPVRRNPTAVREEAVHLDIRNPQGLFRESILWAGCSQIFCFAGVYVFDVRLDFFFRPVPPPEFLEGGYGFVWEAPADWFCRNAADDGIGRHILCHDGTGADGPRRPRWRRRPE